MSSLKRSPSLSILSVHTSSKDQTLQMLRSLGRTKYLEKEIIVIQNSEADEEPILYPTYPEVLVHSTSKPLQFAEAVNFGLSFCSGDLVLVVSDHLEVEPDFLEPLVEAFRKYPKVGALSPRIHSYEDPGVLIYAGADEFRPFSIRIPIVGYKQKDIGQYMDTRLTSSVHRGAMMFSRQVLTEVGMMYEDYIHSFEEYDWCHRMRERGFQIVYVGSSLVHLKSSMSKEENRARDLYYFTRNRLLFTRRNFSLDQRVTSMLFFAFVSIPKNVFSFGLRGEWTLMKAYLKGVWWNLTH
jgi:GT2 family glycosyltransferase